MVYYILSIYVFFVVGFDLEHNVDNIISSYTMLVENKSCGLYLGKQLGTSDLNKQKSQVTDCTARVLCSHINIYLQNLPVCAIQSISWGNLLNNTPLRFLIHEFSGTLDKSTVVSTFMAFLCIVTHKRNSVLLHITVLSAGQSVCLDSPCLTDHLVQYCTK